MGSFSRSSPATSTGPCVACCKAARAADDQLSKATATRMTALTWRPVARMEPAGAPMPSLPQTSPNGRANSDCAQQARTLAPVMHRFNRYREALPSARAAADLNELGDAAGDEPSKKPCLTRLPVSAAGLNAGLGLPPGKIHDDDLRNDQTGFRAAVYRDEESGRMILVPRDTQPDSLADWQTNTQNGVGQDTMQYAAMRKLTSKLTGSGPPFDIAGYSKGGGIAQEGGLLSALSRVRVFNSAGLPDSALAWTGQPDFESLTSRTSAFSAEGDFLTFMNNTTDPGQNILNSHFLKRELAGQGRGLNPINIKVRNPSMRGQVDPFFESDKSKYLAELGDQINKMQTAFDTGGTVTGFPPVRAATKETINDSMTAAGRLFDASSDQPTLGKLAQHKMSAVLDSLESNVAKDRRALQKFVERCG
jgi:hypothetical protein